VRKRALGTRFSAVVVATVLCCCLIVVYGLLSVKGKDRLGHLPAVGAPSDSPTASAAKPAGEAAITGADLGPGTTGSRSTPILNRSAWLYGSTMDDVSDLNVIVASLRTLPRRPTVRIVFDPGEPPAAYTTAVAAIHPYAAIMGLTVDSQDVARYSTADYVARTRAYLAAFADQVDIWEVGNEVNGEWLGSTADVVAKVSSAYDLVKRYGRSTAVTLYCNPGCWSSADHEMLPWAQQHLPARMRTGLDYVFISYYQMGSRQSPV
jgi:hypothetical protein